MAKNDDKIEKLMAEMLERIGEMSPDLLEDVMQGFEKRIAGEGHEVLDDLRDFESNKHDVPTESISDMTLSYYVDFWDYYEDKHPDEDYEEFMEECKDRSRKNSKLAKDINAFLRSIPVYYADDYTLISHQIWMVAAAIQKYDLKACHKPLMDVLRCEDIVIQDIFMDDELGSMNLYADICHEHLAELFNLATDDRVMPYARGVAIGALAKSAIYSLKDTLLIVKYLRQIIEIYCMRAKTDRKVSVELIRATSLIAAKMRMEILMPLISETYRKLRISKKGIGALSRVEEIMKEGDEPFMRKESIVKYFEDFLEFQRMIGNPYNNEEDYNDDDNDEYDKYDDEYDDDDDYDGYNNRRTVNEDRYNIDQLRKVNIINGKVKIVGQNLVDAHPKGISTTTDMDYIKFANGIVKRITGFAVDLTNLDVWTIALKCTLYFEDVIADVGIWRSFVETMRKMYGKPLPFYKVDDKNYYSDEPNYEDVLLLLWLSRLDSHTSGIANPENPVLTNMAKVIYDYMEEMFETMPINEALVGYFHEAAFMHDFYTARDAVKWAYLSSYISCTTKGVSYMIDQANGFYDVYGEEAFYQAESTVIYTNRIGPLGLYAKDWLAMILEANGKTSEAQIIRDITGTCTACHLKERTADSFGNYTLEKPDGTLIEMNKEEFDIIRGEAKTVDYLYGCMIKFDGKWYLSGMSSWNNRFKEGYDEMTENQKKLKKASASSNDKLKKKNGGSPLLYFKDTESMTKFVTKEAGLRLQDINLPLFAESHSYWLVYIPDAGKNMLFVPDIARYICDPNNPFYDDEEAKDEQLSISLNVPYVLSTYLFEHDMLPHAGFNCVDGAEKGKTQVHENYDFIVRCLASEHMQ